MLKYILVLLGETPSSIAARHYAFRLAQSMNAEVTGLAGVDLSYIEEPMQRDGACLLRSALRQCRCGRSRSGKF